MVIGNWYKLFKKANEDTSRWWERNDLTSGNTQYMEIGHENYLGNNKDANDAIWYYDGKEIISMDTKTYVAQGNNPRWLSHTQIWSYDILKGTYKGRYDEDKKLISCSVPPTMFNKYKNIPNIGKFIDSLLLERFGQENRIIHWG